MGWGCLTCDGWCCHIGRGQVPVAVVGLVTAGDGHHLRGRGAAAERAAVLGAEAAHAVVIMAWLYLHYGCIALQHTHTSRMGHLTQG